MPLAGEVIYHAGPCPKGKGVIGSIGPTTSCRMDTYAAGFAGAGVKYSIGKGNRGQDAAKAIAEAGGAHFDAVGGAGAFYMRKVKKAEIFLYPELGAEAVWRLEVEDFPVIVSII
jgi:fumarate hydratase subunit beta